MAAPTLFYSRTKLVGLGLFSVALGLGVLPIAYRLKGDEGFEPLREAYVFYAFGANGPRDAIAIFGLLFAFAGAAALMRAGGGRDAATIRLDGLWVSGLLRSRIIPWRYLESVSLSETRMRGKIHRTLNVRSRRLPGESRLSHLFGRRLSIPARMIDATPEQIVAWARSVEAAHRRALLYPPSAPARPATGAFGRRL